MWLLQSLSGNVLHRSRAFIFLLHACPRYSSNSARPASNPLKGGILQYLCDRFYDIEAFVEFGRNIKKWNTQRKNRYYYEARQHYGEDLTAAVFTLDLMGRVRFQGQDEWYCETKGWKQEHPILEYQDTPLEAVDLSGSIISYEGLENLANLKALKHLDLSRCPSIDDWSLSRLHTFGDTLQELSLAGCPQVTEKGLACLHHLGNLKRLDVSDLPSVDNKGLIRILLEEMLPQCTIVGMNYSDGLVLHVESDSHIGETEEDQGPPWVQKTSEVRT
ncbi:distal membrane-arm assembly complex protein 2 isoform X2 [Hemicordylus capensis]|uniref:distal membrane-arm assembly complex protein 2 isoform X2 n=1 Tax=Hemicordylus capensis TaxID=884348 RepID=UPI002302CF1D|nr:distal membrane-arm assembly complex protein 2 isoform X2 [Hemicordylus capensis]